MRTWKKVVLLSVLGFLEMVFVSLIFASNLPHQRSELDAYTRYQNSPSEENKDLWLKEREKIDGEIRLRISIGCGLATANLAIILWIALKRANPVQYGRRRSC